MEIYEPIEEVNGGEFTIWLNTAHIVEIERENNDGSTVVHMTFMSALPFRARQSGAHL